MHMTFIEVNAHEKIYKKLIKINKDILINIYLNCYLYKRYTLNQ